MHLQPQSNAIHLNRLLGVKKWYLYSYLTLHYKFKIVYVHQFLIIILVLDETLHLADAIPLT